MSKKESFNLKEVWKELRKKKNVHSVSGTLKPKIRDGKVTSELAIRVYVDKKVSVECLSTKDIVPKTINGIPTDVVVIRRMKALSLVTDKFRPTPAGVSAMSYYEGATACTLGWFGKDLADGKMVILCNNHCGANENKLAKGTPYTQPSKYDKGTLDDKLGTLKLFVPLQFQNFQCLFRNVFGLRKYFTKQVFNQVDLAIIDIPDTWQIEKEIFGIGKVFGKRTGTLGELVEKTGRTTSHTTGGTLIDNDWYGQVDYSRGVVEFGPCGLIAGTGFSGGGDSSSAIVFSSDKAFTGLLFAGSDTHTIFCHWNLIEQLGNVEILVSKPPEQPMIPLPEKEKKVLRKRKAKRSKQ